MLNETQLTNRIQWVRDLLSGEFEQGVARLKRTARTGGINDPRKFVYCCLGVACERIDPSNYSLTQENDNIGDPKSTMSVQGFLSISFGQEHLGISYDDQVTFGSMNDDHGWPFSKIADVIAYATANDIDVVTLYTTMDPEQTAAVVTVPEGFATGWLEQYND